MPILSDIEDRLLAMCEGDVVTPRLAQRVLSIWYERKVDNKQIIHLANRLAKLGYLNWQYQKRQRLHIKKKLSYENVSNARLLTFKATKAGELYLAQPREVT